MRKIICFLLCLIGVLFLSCSDFSSSVASESDYKSSTSKVTFKNNQGNKITILLINDEAEVYKKFEMTQNEEQIIAHFENGHYKFKIGDIYQRYDVMPDLYISKDTVITITYKYPNFVATFD